MTDSPFEPDWEHFYRDYRKPGFIPGYEILNKLGGGAFGIVFKARKESIGKDYAVKFLKLDEPGVRGAVLKELEGVGLFAQIDHPNLVTIEDRGEVLGIPYIIMGYAGEGTLRGRIDTGPMAREEALRIFAQIARGLQALHDHSLVHFDLKPGNVFLRGDIARIGDYGLSKLVSASHNSLSFGRGTPYYMAPEQLQQRGDARSDIYSLGVILYESLSGVVPFCGDSEWEILRKHENEEPTFPRSIEDRERRVIARCLHKNPAARYQSVAEVLHDLFVAAAPQPSTQPPTPPPIHHAPPSSHQRAACPPCEPRPPRASHHAHLRRRSPALRIGLMIFVGIMLLPFLWTAVYAVNRKVSQLRSHRTVSHRPAQVLRSHLGPLLLPDGTTSDRLRWVRDNFERLREGKLSRRSARYRLKSYGPTAIVFGANELVSLDYMSRSDMNYCEALQDVLGSIVGRDEFEFRCRTVPNRGRITRGTAERNLRTANKFWHYVQDQDY